MIDKVFPKIHNEGYKFLVIFGLGTLVLYLISGFLGLIGVILTIWVYYFFRDPERFPINDENYLVSPADGLVIKVEEVNGPSELSLENKKFTKVSVFMNVFDCHVNRIPCSGEIEEILYKPGKFLNASLDKVTETNNGEKLNQGDRIGMIRFGSRADIYFENYKPLVKVNQRAVAGETLIAKK